MAKLIHKGLGVEFEIVDLKQRHVAAQGAAMRRILAAADVSMEDASISEFYGGAVQSAVDAGWFAEGTILDVDDASPAVVKWLAAEVNRLYLEATEIPKN